MQSLLYFLDCLYPHLSGGGLTQYPGRLLSYTEPLGLVLIIVSWNYPVQLVFSPLVAAIAAGNCAAVKPSELAPKTQQVVQTIIEETFDSTYISVFTGGAEVGQALLKEDFDHIFFVGSPRVGQYVMRAAAFQKYRRDKTPGYTPPYIPSILSCACDPPIHRF